MRQFGLTGFPLGHSFSKRYFTDKFGKEGLACRYDNFEIESIDLLPKVLTDNPNLEGLNVTIPYKEQVIPYLDSISAEAAEIGAVNCIKITDGKLRGYNTDALGAGQTIDTLTKTKPVKALVLGTGGASKAVRYALRVRDIPFITVSRRRSDSTIAYEDLTDDIMASHLLIINTTPLGMFPKTDAAPDIPYDALSKRHMLFDLVYNPAETLFLKRGAEHGAHTVCGGDMLVAQAEKSWEIWNE